MIVDLKSFCADISRAESQKSVDTSNLSSYLMQNLFIPYVTGKNIRLDSLDYDAFTLPDMDNLFRFIGDLEDTERKLEPMRSKLGDCHPAARKIKGFC